MTKTKSATGTINTAQQSGSDADSELISMLQACGAVKFGEFTLASGRKSPYYVDIKCAITNPDVLEAVQKKMSAIINENVDIGDIDAVAGVELGGVPLATAVSLYTHLPLVIIRKSIKGYGTGGRIVGELKPGMKVVLVEDVTTTGVSVMDAIEEIRKNGCLVTHVITVVDRCEGAQDNLSAIDVELLPLVRASEFIK